VGTVISFIGAALHSDHGVLVTAALLVIQSFDDTFHSINVVGPQLLPSILPLLVNPSEDVRGDAYKAMDQVLEISDTAIDGLFDGCWNLVENVVDGEMPQYLGILARLVKLTPDFDDEKCERVLELLARLMDLENTENLDEKAAGLQLAIAILHHDAAQLDFVAETVFPALTSMWEVDDLANVDTMLIFIREFVSLVRDAAIPYIAPYLERICQLTQDNLREDIRGSVCETLALICRFSGELAPDLLDCLVNVMKAGLNSDDDIFKEGAVEAVKKSARLLNPEVSLEIFRELLKLADEADEDGCEFNGLCIFALAKLFKHCAEANLPEYLAAVTAFLESVITANAQFLTGIPLDDYPHNSDIIPSLCSLTAVWFAYRTELTNAVCQFMLQWMTKDKELDLSQIIGSLTECLQHATVSPELHPAILQSVVDHMESASEPSFLQNVANLLNLLITLDPSILPNVIGLLPILERWRSTASSEKFGYQEVLSNIASLYLQIAIRSSDFPEELAIAALAEFPPADVSETGNMSKAIVQIAQQSASPDLLTAIALAISRFIVWDVGKVGKANLPEEMVAALVAVFVAIAGQNEYVRAQVRSSVARQSSKLRKIDHLLS
jgi:hypothetical protein